MSVFHEFTSKGSKVLFISTINERMDGELFINISGSAEKIQIETKSFKNILLKMLPNIC